MLPDLIILQYYPKNWSDFEVPKYCNYSPCRPWQDHSGGQDAAPVRCFWCAPARRGTGDGFESSGKRAGDYDHLQECFAHVEGGKDQSGRYSGPCGLRWRGRAHPPDGGRCAAAGRRGRGAHASDPFCNAKSTGVRCSADRGDQQDRQT